MAKAITTLIVLAVLIVGGIWLYNRNDNVATEGAPTDENYTGTGGPEAGYDPLDLDIDGDVDADDAAYESKG